MTSAARFHRIVVTGTGLVSPLGTNVRQTYDALLRGESGIRTITRFDTSTLRTSIAAEVMNFDPASVLPEREVEHHGRVVALALGAANEAISEANLADVDHTRVATLVSSGQGAIDIFIQQVLRVETRGARAASPYFIPSSLPNALTGVISHRHGFMGPSFNVTSACATGAHAIALGAMLLAADDCDVAVVGGAEAAITPYTIAGFGNARALAKPLDGSPERASRPYDRRRSGFVIGEGAGVLVLERELDARARGRTALAYLAGYGMSSDAEHMTRPHPEGLGLRLAIEAALRRAGLRADDIDSVNPHATSTPAGDVAEYVALRDVLGPRLATMPMSATKSAIGHLLGGAGALESIVCVRSLVEQRIHPHLNVDELDDGFELSLPRTALELPLEVMLKTSAGFGGHNAALLFARA